MVEFGDTGTAGTVVQQVGSTAGWIVQESDHCHGGRSQGFTASVVCLHHRAEQPWLLEVCARA